MKSILKSISTGTEYPLNEVRFTSDNGELLDVIHDFDAIKKQYPISREYFSSNRSLINGQPSGGVWHFKELVLPTISEAEVVSKQEGNTRLYRSQKISSWLGLNKEKFYLKSSIFFTSGFNFTFGNGRGFLFSCSFI